MKQETIFTLIKTDHRKVEALFAAIEGTTERAQKKRDKLYAQLRTELTAHSKAEERAVYPRLKQNAETEDIGYESVEEHDVVKFLFAKLDALDTTSKEWTAAITVLKEVVAHHVKEEEKEMFKQMKAAFGAEELEEMALEFPRAKRGMLEKVVDAVAA